MPDIIASDWYKAHFKNALFTYFPAYLFILFYGWVLTSRLQLARVYRLLVRIAFLGACLTPLSLHFFGFDMPRWNAIVVFCSFCCVSTVGALFSGGEGEDRLRYSGDRTLLAAFAAVVIVVGIGSGGELYDEMKLQTYPYKRLTAFIEDWVRNDFSYIPKI
jgi:hypothetical protein